MGSLATNINLAELRTKGKVRQSSGHVFIDLVHIPELPETEERALWAKLIAQLDEEKEAVFLNKIDTALRNISRRSSLSTESATPPPPTEEEQLAEDLKLEEDSRKALLRDGVPPCYPPDLDIFAENIFDEPEILSYWTSFGLPKCHALTAQLRDWKQFRGYQQKTRRLYMKRGTFSRFVNEVCMRRQKHGLDNDIHLLACPEQQGWLENWIEFQDYHLILYENKLEEWKQQLKVNREGKKRGLWKKTRKDGLGWKTTCAIPLKLGGRDILKDRERKVREERKMLNWIEHHRSSRAMDQSQLPQKRNEDRSRSVMSKKSSHHRRQRIKAQQNTSKTPEERQLKRKIDPQRMSETSAGKCKEQVAHTSTIFRTRSGRISKRPQRYV